MKKAVDTMETDTKIDEFTHHSSNGGPVLPFSASFLFFYVRFRLNLYEVVKSDEQLARPTKNFFPSEQRRQTNALRSRGDKRHF